MKEASTITNVGKTLISMCCRNKIPYAKNYIWKYKNEEDKTRKTIKR